MLVHVLHSRGLSQELSCAPMLPVGHILLPLLSLNSFVIPSEDIRPRKRGISLAPDFPTPYLCVFPANKQGKTDNDLPAKQNSMAANRANPLPMDTRDKCCPSAPDHRCS